MVFLPLGSPIILNRAIKRGMVAQILRVAHFIEQNRCDQMQIWRGEIKSAFILSGRFKSELLFNSSSLRRSSLQPRLIISSCSEVGFATIDQDASSIVISSKAPVDQFVEHGAHIIGAAVLIIEVVRMLPYVNGEERL